MAVDEDRARWEKNLRFFTNRVDGEDGHRHDFTIMCNGKRFVVTKTQDEIEDIIYEAEWRKFAPLAPGIERGPSNPPISLHSAFNPETFYFRLVIDGGNADVIQEHPSRSNYVPSYLDINIPSNLPRYSAREILFTKKLMGTGYIAEVSVNGQDMCYKIMEHPHGKAVQREYECLKKIADSKYASSIKAPRLVGFVVDGGDNVEVIGILEEYIPHTMNLGGSPGDIKAVASERRRKWAEQVRRNVELLHEIGVVWGDGKPENVLINSETDDCCLVDFGGSWTNGWVDAKLMETEAGDEQAVTRIFDFLGV